MRIISRDELMAMPEGVWYCEYVPQVFGELCVKDKTLSCDWFMSRLLELGSSDEIDQKLNSGASFSLEDDSIGRDGCFADDQLYAVLEVNDLISIQIKVERALGLIEEVREIL